MDKFESFYNRAKLIVNNRKRWPTFRTRLQRNIALDVFKEINAGNDKFSFIKRDTMESRNKRMLHLPRIKLEAGRKTTYYQGASIFNRLPTNICEQNSIVLFRNMVNEFEFDK